MDEYKYKLSIYEQVSQIQKYEIMLNFFVLIHHNNIKYEIKDDGIIFDVMTIPKNILKQMNIIINTIENTEDKFNLDFDNL